MTGLLSRIGTVEARIFATPCPLGTSGRIYAQRLRRQFQQSTRSESTVAAAAAILDEELSQASFDKAKQHAHNAFIGDAAPASGRLDPDYTINGLPLNIARFIPNYGQKSDKPSLYKPTKQVSFRIYDQFFFNYKSLKRQFDPDAPSDYDNYCDPNRIQAEVDRVLQSEDPHIALLAIARLSYLPSFGLVGITQQKFSELLKMADIEYFFGKHSDFDKYVPDRSPFYVRLRDATLPSERSPIFRLRGMLFKLFAKRQSCGAPLQLSDFKYVFSLWNIFGFATIEQPILDMMKRSGVKPDAELFNLRMNALVNEGVWSREHRYEKMITRIYWPLTDEKRQNEQVNRSKVSALFQEMMRSGVVATEETMCLMLTVFAREGDMDAVKHVLDSVWGINLYKFLALGEEGIGKDFADDSPIRPTGRLIETIAHVFGTNQDVALALRLMDFLSRRYELEIPLEAWEEILERAFILSTWKKPDRIHSTSEKHPRKQLPKDAAENLWNTMTGPPYNVQPNMKMYDWIITSLIKRQAVVRAENLMEEGRVLHKQNVAKFVELMRAWRYSKERHVPYYYKFSEATQQIRLEHEIWQAKMAMHRSRQYIREWVRDLIECRRWSEYNLLSGDNMTGVIRNWKLYLPKKVKYQTTTGTVQLNTNAHQVNDFRVKDFQRRYQERSYSDITIRHLDLKR